MHTRLTVNNSDRQHTPEVQPSAFPCKTHPHRIASPLCVNSNMEESFGNLGGTHFYFLAETACAPGDG